MVRLAGMLGTSPARDSVRFVRNTAAKLSPPAGLNVHVTGPGATIVDEFAEIDRQMFGITAAAVGLILLLLLVVYRSPIAPVDRLPNRDRDGVSQQPHGSFLSA
jgi:putative drug exporter of the RND superfamily